MMLLLVTSVFHHHHYQEACFVAGQCAVEGHVSGQHTSTHPTPLGEMPAEHGSVEDLCHSVLNVKSVQEVQKRVEKQLPQLYASVKKTAVKQASLPLVFSFSEAPCTLQAGFASIGGLRGPPMG